MNERSEGDRMFWDNVAGADFKRQLTAESYRQFFVDAGYPDVRVSPADWGFTHLPAIRRGRRTLAAAADGTPGSCL